MAGGIDLELTLQDQKFIAGLLRSAGAQKQFTSEVDKTKAAAAKAEKELDRMAQSVKKITATPLEKYNAELGKLNTLQARGKITATEYTRAVEMQRAQLELATVGTQKLKAATASVGGSKNSVLEIAGALGIVTTAAGAAQAAIGQITAAMKAAAQQSKEGADQTKGLAGARANLVQISGGDPKKYAELEAEAKKLEDKGIPRDAARGLVFAANSEGWQGELQQVAAAHQVANDDKALSQVAGQVPAMYRNAGVKIGNLEAANLVMKASEQSRMDFAPMGVAMVQAAEGGTKAGTSPEELAALTGFLAGEYKSGDVAAQRISSFGSEIAITDDLRGLGHLGAFRKIRDEYTQEQREEWLGKDQGRNMFYQSMLQNEGEIERRKKELQGEQAEFAAGGGVIRKQIALTEKDAGFAALRQTQVEVNQRDRVKEEKLGQSGLAVEAAVAKNERQDLEANRGALARGFSKNAAGVAAEYGASAGGVGVAGKVGGVVGANIAEAANPSGGLVEAAKMILQAANIFKSTAENKPNNHARLNADAVQPVN